MAAAVPMSFLAVISLVFGAVAATAAPAVGLVSTHVDGHMAAASSTEAAHTAKMAELQANVQKAMLALYMEGATYRMDQAKKQPATPFGHLSRFGREDTAYELTEASIAESNAMVDQIERAVVSETKRSMFRALTHLRGVTVSSYDGMANAQAENIDDYARQNAWSKAHNLDHLAEQEGNTQTWAFHGHRPPQAPDVRHPR
eukprot:gnl/TRDRNA2_/TRDRNA2_132087_c0_seq3.p1 gnl/TRDRNA2_/TRDRNA2_132087_c0~~gnl/TRDRNA2_/TRDRNA2_132087_c0_seq3.p1  ORF type:complete len:201 (+),score=45.90 gnl/TRDRNA2_/TRDRNA2_132087_c0_seq3:80-682(+)